jgi:hypothetical protein
MLFEQIYFECNLKHLNETVTIESGKFIFFKLKMKKVKPLMRYGIYIYAKLQINQRTIHTGNT